MSRWLCLLFAAFTFSMAGGCATISAPMKVADPVPIYLAEYSVHSDILMPRDGGWVGYTFSDWNYAAMNHTLPNDALGALALSWGSAMEKRTAAADPHTGSPLLYDNPELVIRLYADRELVEHRLHELEKRFNDDVARHKTDGYVANADKTRIYVRDDQHYSVANDCNDMTADTLRSLGFQVDGIVVGSHFHVSEEAMLGPAPAINASDGAPVP